MPSFDAPVDIVLRGSPRLLLWHLTVHGAAVAAALAGACVLRAGPVAAVPLVVLAGAVALSGWHACRQELVGLRRGEAAGVAAGRLRLEATGRLTGTLPGGREICLHIASIVATDALVALRPASRAWQSPPSGARGRAGAGAGDPRSARGWPAALRPAAVYLSRDAVDPDAFRRLNAWARAGLPDPTASAARPGAAAVATAGRTG